MAASFLAILRDRTATTVRQIDVSREVQSELSAEFERQALAFMQYSHSVEQNGRTKRITEESERIGFFPIYHLNSDSQIFEQPTFELDAEILAASKSPDSCDPLVLDNVTIKAIRAICASYSTRNSLRILFQPFDRRRVLAINKWAFLQSGTTFSKLERPGFTLGDRLVAIYDNGSLLFRSYAVVARFVNLLSVFNEASTEKMESVLKHKVLSVANLDDVILHADATMRRQFAAVAELGVLDKAKPNVVKAAAAEFGIEVGVAKHDGKLRIGFPENKREQKEFLTFLTEGFYLGPITGIKYQSNSHRPWKKGN